MLQKIELMPNIAWVRVALHDDTEIVENNGAEELVLAGDSIVICTTILPTELEKLVNEELIEIDLDNIKLTNKGLDLANLVWEEFV